MEIKAFRSIGISIALAASLGGCGLFGSDQEPETLVVEPAPTIASQSPPNPRSTPPSVNAFIQPTNPDERLRVIQGGRVDPFAALVPGAPPASSGGGSGAGASGAMAVSPPPTGSTGSAGPVAIVPPPGQRAPSTTRPSGTRVSPAPSRSSQPSRSTTPPSRVAAQPRQTAASRPSSAPLDLPDLSGSGNGLSLPPQPQPQPQPDLARAVKVTGFAVLKGVPRAIVQAPNERTSRSVTAGDRLSNGQVLVRRIDFSNPDQPRVILEEAGTTVAVAAGQPAVQIAAAADRLSPIPGLW